MRVRYPFFYTLNPNPYDRYTVFATEYAANKFKAPKRILSKAEQQAIAIHALLSDGEWHTAADVMAHFNLKSKRHIQNIMQSLANPLAIASGQHGYCIPNKHTILIA